MNGELEREPESDPELMKLHAAWRAMTPPDPTAGLESPDPRTAATLDWMRAAWSASAPAAPPALPWRLRLQLARRRAAPSAPWLAAAAAVIAAIALFVRDGARDRVREATTPPCVELATEPNPAPPRADPEVDAPKLVSLTADRMELRSGPVRLILFNPSQESPR